MLLVRAFGLSLRALTVLKSRRLAVQDSNAGVKMGPSSDVNIYRQASNVLKTDNNLVVSGGLAHTPSCNP